MDNIILTKVASVFKDNNQKYNISIIDKDSLDISLEHVKGDILTTLINVSSKFNRFKATIILEIDCGVTKSEPLEIKYDIVDINDIDKIINDILEKYEEALESSYMRIVYFYSTYLVINTCAL